MAKYGPRASRKVEQVMRERKRGTLRSGSGRKVTSRRQALAIALNEARRDGAKVPAAGRTRSKKKAGGTARARTTRKTSRSTGTKATRARPRTSSNKRSTGGGRSPGRSSR